MRRESSTVVALVGEVSSGLLAGLGRSPNVSVARPPEAESPRPAAAAGASTQAAPAVSAGASRPGWETGAEAMREAAGAADTGVTGRTCGRHRSHGGIGQ